MTESTTGRKPQDHKQKKGAASDAIEIKRQRDEMLADMPELRPSHELRFRERARVSQIMAEAVGRGVIDDEGSVEFDVMREEDRRRLDALLDVAGMIDEFAESIAIDRDAYVEWSREAKADHFFAILSRYYEAVGESTGS